MQLSQTKKLKEIDLIIQTVFFIQTNLRNNRPENYKNS